MSQEEHNSVVVVGSTMIDLISYSSRVPEAGETIVGDSFQMTFGGKGANQAVMASILGSRIGFINCLGKDVYGDSYRENLEKYDIDLTYLTEGKGPTGVATILVEPDGTNRIIIVPGANFELTSETAREGILNFTPRVVVGQLEVSADATYGAFLAAKEKATQIARAEAIASIFFIMWNPFFYDYFTNKLFYNADSFEIVQDKLLRFREILMR